MALLQGGHRHERTEADPGRPDRAFRQGYARFRPYRRRRLGSDQRKRPITGLQPRQPLELTRRIAGAAIDAFG